MTKNRVWPNRAWAKLALALTLALVQSHAKRYLYADSLSEDWLMGRLTKVVLERSTLKTGLMLTSNRPMLYRLKNVLYVE